MENIHQASEAWNISMHYHMFLSPSLPFIHSLASYGFLCLLCVTHMFYFLLLQTLMELQFTFKDSQMIYTVTFP